MSQQELLAKVVPVLEALGIDFMVTGSIASSIQGEPRLTHDVDLVVTVPADAVDALVASFPSPEFLLQKDAIQDALQHRSMFNLLWLQDGSKVDFWLLTDEPFDISRFSRRQRTMLDDLHLFVSAPEDTILAKLRWSRLSGGSEKQFNDALSVYELQAKGMDCEYLGRWAEALGVVVELQRLIQTAKPL